jgi:hypothetical protein
MKEELIGQELLAIINAHSVPLPCLPFQAAAIAKILGKIQR